MEPTNSKAVSYIQACVDHPAFGCGYRWFIMFDRGSKLVSLCEPPTGFVARVPIGSFKIVEENHSPKWGKLQRRLNTRLKSCKRWGHKTNKSARDLAKRLKKA